MGAKEYELLVSTLNKLPILKENLPLKREEYELTSRMVFSQKAEIDELQKELKTRDLDVERISFYRTRVIAKEPITKGLLGDDITDVEKNSNILTLSPVYIDNEYELVDDGGIGEYKEYRIEDIYGDDIIVSGESFNF